MSRMLAIVPLPIGKDDPLLQTLLEEAATKAHENGWDAKNPAHLLQITHYILEQYVTRKEIDSW